MQRGKLSRHEERKGEGGGPELFGRMRCKMHAYLQFRSGMSNLSMLRLD